MFVERKKSQLKHKQHKGRLSSHSDVAVFRFWCVPLMDRRSNERLQQQVEADAPGCTWCAHRHASRNPNLSLFPHLQLCCDPFPSYLLSPAEHLTKDLFLWQPPSAAKQPKLSGWKSVFGRKQIHPLYGNSFRVENGVSHFELGWNNIWIRSQVQVS